MLNRTKFALAAAIVAATASVAVARPAHATRAPDAYGAAAPGEGRYVPADAGWGSYVGLDSRSPASKELDPTGGSFQGP